MSGKIKLIVGLGNPGSKYAETRHNAGFWFVEALAEKYSVTFREEPKFFGEVAKISLEGESIWLLKPTTFMNRSGQAVAALANYYKIPVQSILAVHDELDLPSGQVRLKSGGGHAGHNGLRDITAHLSADFHRVRVGIGRPTQSGAVSDYVLNSPSKAKRIEIDVALDAVLKHLPEIVRGEFQKAMNSLHQK